MLKMVMGLGLVFAAGCSSSSISKTRTPTLMPTSASIPTVIAKRTVFPYTGKIAFVGYDLTDNRHLYVMNANGGMLIDITPPNLPRIEFLSWSPDGQYIAFDAWKDNSRQIFKIAPNGSGLAQLTFDKNGGSNPSWSPDGRKIAFISSNPDILDYTGVPGAPQIYVMNSDGTGIYHFLVKTKPDNTIMTGFYRKDGLLAVEEPITRYAVANYVVDPDGVIQKQYPEFSTETPIAWSPDDNFVAYAPTRRTPGCWGIVVMKFDKSEQECLMDQQSNSPIYFAQISWSPDGKYIMFSSNLNGGYDLYVMQRDGSGLAQLTYTPRHEDWAAWWGAP
jgi:TolB protein